MKISNIISTGPEAHPHSLQSNNLPTVAYHPIATQSRYPKQTRPNIPIRRDGSRNAINNLVRSSHGNDSASLAPACALDDIPFDIQREIFLRMHNDASSLVKAIVRFSRVNRSSHLMAKEILKETWLSREVFKQKTQYRRAIFGQKMHSLANDARLSDQACRTAFQALFDDKTDACINLSTMPENRRDIALEVLRANHTRVQTLDLAAPNLPAKYSQVSHTLNTLTDQNPGLLQVTLDVSGNRIGDAEVQVMATINGLTSLKVRSNKIRVAGAQALAANPTLTSLDACHNYLGTDGAQALASSKTLTRLDLMFNNIGNAGAQACANNTTLTWLNMCSNNIGFAGAQALADNMRWTHLDLRGNYLTDAGTQALSAAQTGRNSHCEILM